MLVGDKTILDEVLTEDVLAPLRGLFFTDVLVKALGTMPGMASAIYLAGRCPMCCKYVWSMV